MKVAFICVHNSCRSQMAEAVSKILASDVFEAVSAGTHIAPEINPMAVEIIQDKYGVDMRKTQYSKTLDEICDVDIVVTMGCNVDCPHVVCSHREDWGLDDPSGLGYAAFEKTLKLIEEKVLDLKDRIENLRI